MPPFYVKMSLGDYMKRILLLGATGSIGLQTVDVIEQHPDLFCLGEFVLEQIVQS